MKAVIYTKYGPPEVLRIEELPKPVPQDDEVLIKVRATTVSSGDARLRSFTVPAGFWLPGRLALGIFGPRNKILGSELAGEIEALGRNVNRFKVADQVFAGTGTSLGGHVEYKCLREDGAIALKPANLALEEAAALTFGGTTALFFLRDQGKIKSGHRVLINGASGSIGTAAIQLAKYFGAEVTGICSSANASLVRSLGADHVIDYKAEDYSKSDISYDIIFDTVGKLKYSRSKRVLAANGSFLTAVAGATEFAQMLWTSVVKGRRVRAGIAIERQQDLQLIKEIVELGKLKPVVDRRYPLEQIVEAHRYVDGGHKKGNVVVTMA